DVHLGRRELDLREGRHEGRVAGAERGGIEDRRVEALIVGRIESVDDLALQVRVKDLDLHAELFGIAADALVVFGQGHGTEDLELDLAAHVHACAVDHQDLGHRVLRWSIIRAPGATRILELGSFVPARSRSMPSRPHAVTRENLDQLSTAPTAGPGARRLAAPGKEGVPKDLVGDASALSDALRLVERPMNAEIDPALAVFFLGLRQRRE